MLTNEYTAGLFDGEGSISVLRRAQTTLSLRVQVTNTNEAILRELRETYGGWLYLSAYRRAAHHKPQWVWGLNSHAGQDFLKQVLPFLRIKQEEARLALLMPVMANGQNAPPLAKLGQLAAFVALRKRPWKCED